VILVILGSQVS